jgi:long-chain acyl-CoA synthetase
MNDLDFSCAGLLPLIAPLEAMPAIRDDRSDVWLTRADARAASLELAGKIASGRKQLVFLFCGANKETVIGLLAAAAAGHATALIDPSLPEDRLKGLIEAYRPEIALGARDFGETMRAVAPGKAGSLESRAGAIEWVLSAAGPPSAPIDPALTVLLSTSGTTGSRK